VSLSFARWSGNALAYAASDPEQGRWLIYVRISMDMAHGGHSVANQLEQKARERGWTVVYRVASAGMVHWAC
jgi:hypothetical protein